MVTAVALRPPVVGQDASLAPFEADLVLHGALLSHYSAAAADAKDGDEAAELEAAVARAQVGRCLFEGGLRGWRGWERRGR